MDVPVDVVLEDERSLQSRVKEPTQESIRNSREEMLNASLVPSEGDAMS